MKYCQTWYSKKQDNRYTASYCSRKLNLQELYTRMVQFIWFKIHTISLYTLAYIIRCFLMLLFFCGMASIVHLCRWATIYARVSFLNYLYKSTHLCQEQTHLCRSTENHQEYCCRYDYSCGDPGCIHQCLNKLRENKNICYAGSMGWHSNIRSMIPVQDASSSRLSTNPSLQEQLKPPRVLLQIWSQLCEPWAHSSMSEEKQ